MLAAEDTGGTTLLLIASINFRNSSTGANIYVGVRSRSGLEVYREADWKSIAYYYCFPDNIFDNKRVKTLKSSSFLL